MSYPGWLISLFLISVFNSYSSIPKVKVRIAKNLNNVTIIGHDLKNDFNIARKKKKYKGASKLRFKCRPFARRVPAGTKAIRLASVSSKRGLVRWNNESYRGNLNVVLSNSKKCDLVNEVSLEHYISSLLAKEMHKDWPLEALKAQAIAARSYAFHKIQSKQVARTIGHDPLYDLESSQKHQVSGSFNDESYSTTKATRQTKGMILTLADKKSTPIFFHSKCGGHTLEPDKVWSEKVAGYESVKCPYCHDHGNKDWLVEVKPKQLVSLIDKTLRDYHYSKIASKTKKLSIQSDHHSRPYLSISDGGEFKDVKKSRLRVKLGYQKALSNNYQIMKAKGKLVLKGKGRGHGVGLCQFGAFEMAKRGYKYHQILKHYFPNHKIKVLYL